MAYAGDVSYLRKMYATSRKETLAVINYTVESRLHWESVKRVLWARIAKAPSERLSWHMEHMTLKMGEPLNVKLSVEEAVDPVEDWYEFCDTLTRLYVEE
jgi:hypothetical protein